MIDHNLATYGTLGPGRPNHHQLSMLRGEWKRGVVYGRLVEKGWGATMGFPALELDQDGDPIEVDLLQSADLPAHWERLDSFEGAGYRRAAARISVGSTIVDAWIYVAV